ncbi:xylulokinase [Tranquillimonas rosea]|uniref:xylulokinase n=1 Tax=Tranquillimonas rosea TaxID=641238 RepID=UPI003BA87056
MYLGVDLGTSSIKVIVADAADRVLASARCPVATARPAPGRVEQAPPDWIAAFETAMDALAASDGALLPQVGAIGVAGHMHAHVLLDALGAPVRPASLWNDFRAHDEARELAGLGYDHRLGVRPMAGFTGPKLLWTARHDPDALSAAERFVFPKDVLRHYLTGAWATDPSDAAGSWLYDQASGCWDAAALSACGADGLTCPPLLPSGDVAGHLREPLARRWGLPPGLPVATGAGDVAAGAVGLGVVREGDAMISLGTSAQVFAARAAYRPNTGRLVHSFAHAVGGTWFDMAALLNGSGALDTTADWLGYADVAALLAEVEAQPDGPGALLALPYLSGERTPHDDMSARAAFVGMSGGTERWELARAMIDALAFSLADGRDAIGAAPDEMLVIGGGSRSDVVCRTIADVLGVTLVRGEGGEVGPALGAARLARAAATGAALDDLGPPWETAERIAPDPARHAAYAPRLAQFRALYPALSPTFQSLGA